MTPQHEWLMRIFFAVAGLFVLGALIAFAAIAMIAVFRIPGHSIPKSLAWSLLLAPLVWQFAGDDVFKFYRWLWSVLAIGSACAWHLGWLRSRPDTVVADAS